MKIGKHEIKAFLFDKDGTIFDSEALHCRGWVESAKAFNVHFTAEMYQDFIGLRIGECYPIAHKLFGRDFPMEDFIKFNDNWVDKRKAAGIAFKKGFEAFFKQVRLTGLPIGLVTSASEAATQLSFTQFPDLLAAFSVKVTGDQVKCAKPDPRCYLDACQQLGIKPENALVFEDSLAGVTAGVAAGCQTVAIPDILPIPEELLKKCAYSFESLEDALSFFEPNADC